MTKTTKIVLLMIAMVLIIGLGFLGYYLINKKSNSGNSNSNQSSDQTESLTQTTKSNDDKTEVVKTDSSANLKLEKITQTNIDGASLWLFAVPDNQDQVILSTENNGSIKMAKFDLDNPTKKPDWKIVVSANDIDGKSVADHWHEFANSYHWIAFSISQADTGYLLKLDRDLDKIKLAKIVEKITLKEGEVPMVNPMNPYLPTNDMFLVPENDGAVVGFYLPGTGHRLFSLDPDLNLEETKNIGGGDYVHGNGSSALKTKTGFDLLAVDQMNMLQQGGVNLIKFDSDWNPQNKTSLVDLDKTNIGMASGVYTPEGTLIMNARVYEGAYPKGEMPPPANPNAPLAQDGGKIKRFIFDSNYQLISTEEIYSQGDANRPHTSLIGDKLLTTWDAGGKTYLRIDKISY